MFNNDIAGCLRGVFSEENLVVLIICSTASAEVFEAEFFSASSCYYMSKAQCFAVLCVLELYLVFFCLVLHIIAATRLTKVFACSVSGPKLL